MRQYKYNALILQQTQTLFTGTYSNASPDVHISSSHQQGESYAKALPLEAESLKQNKVTSFDGYVLRNMKVGFINLDAYSSTPHQEVLPRIRNR